MQFCPDCGTKVSEEIRFCPECGHQLGIEQDTKGKITYSRALRWISGVLGVLTILAAIGELMYFVESGLESVLIVGMIDFAIGIILLLMAIFPNWVRSTFKIKLEKGSVFGVAVVVLFIASIIAIALGPEIPSGWWNY